MKKDFKQILVKIAKMKELMQTMEEACIYLEQAPNDYEVAEVFLQGAATLRTQSEELFSYNMNLTSEKPTLKNFESWKQSFWIQNMQQIWNLINQIQNNQLETIPQCDKYQINLLIDILKDSKINVSQGSIVLLALSNFCRLSEPELSFQLIIESFEKNPTIFSNSNGHLKNYIYSPNVWKEQIEFKVCPICGGKGHAFHNSPSYLMEDFSDIFLPSKLWIHCDNCGNLFTKYFAKRYLLREKEILQITPQPCDVYKCSNISVNFLHFWGNILKKMKRESSGNSLLEVGIGQGGLIAAAKEIGISVRCVEINKQVAQDIANLLQVNITCCDFLEFPENTQYDMISMGDVIEHLSNPRKGLEKAMRLLRKNGVLWISTPNYESSYNQLHHMHTAMWLEPAHVTYFNRQGLQNLLSDVGFEIIDYNISSHYNGSMEILAKKK